MPPHHRKGRSRGCKSRKLLDQNGPHNDPPLPGGTPTYASSAAGIVDNFLLQYQEITRKLYTISTEPNIPDGSLVNVPTTDEPDGQKKQYQVKLSLVKLSQTADNLQLTSGRSPGYSIDSTKSKVIVNTVQVMMADSTIYRYDVAIPPDTLSVAMNPKLGDTCRELGVVALGVFFYDGKKNLYSPVWLNSYDGLYKFAIPCQSPQGNHPSTLYTIKVVFASMIHHRKASATLHTAYVALNYSYF